MNQKVAIVTGSSTGIGYETSLTLARNGFLTYATMRNLNKAENIKSVTTKEGLSLHIKHLDVTDDVSVKNAVEAILSETVLLDDVIQALKNSLAYTCRQQEISSIELSKIVNQMFHSQTFH